MYEDFNTLEKRFAFCRKYAGNVNGLGSMKFADSFIDELNSCLEISKDDLTSSFSEYYEKINKIRDIRDSVVSNLENMGRTNSYYYAAKVKYDASIGEDLCKELTREFQEYK